LLNADCAALIFSGFGGAIFHFKPSIFQKARLERAQTRRKTGANSRKRAQIKIRYHLRFQIGPFFNSEHEGFWLTYFDVTNVW
jgi:hypothetical protein